MVIKLKEQNIEKFVNSKKKNVTMKLSNSRDAYFQYDELDPYMIKQHNIYISKILRGKKDNNNDKDNINELDPFLPNKLKEINHKKENKNNINK